MSKFGGGEFTLLLVDGVDLLGTRPKALTYKTESITEPTPGLGLTHEEHTPVGMRRAMLTQEGALFDAAVGGWHQAFRAAGDQVRRLVFSYRGNQFTGAEGHYLGSYEVLVSNGALTKANASYVVSGEVDLGTILQLPTPQTVDWTSAAVDNGASSATGGVGYLQVTALAGITGFIGKIRHSPDNVTYADLVTFANVTAAPTSQRIAVAGTINRYLRFEGDITGTGSITVFAGFARNDPTA